MKKFSLIILLMLIACSVNSQVNSSLQTTEGYLSFTVDNNYDRLEINYPVSAKTFNLLQEKYGEPEIPVIQKRFVLPLDAEQISVQVTSSSLQTISGSYNLYPEQPPIVLDGREAPDWVDPDPIIYQSNDPYPGKLLEITHTEYTFGYLIVTVNLYPISYLPLSQTIKLYTDISFQINYAISTNPVDRPLKISNYRNEITRNHISSIVSNTGDVDNFLGGAEQIVQDYNGEKLTLSSFPTSDANIPEFIIITSEEYSQPVTNKYDFTDFADWKTKTGIPTVIVTLEQINLEYNGSDQAERIFYYLQDVYNHWGSMFILLGGDIEILPVRYALKVEGEWRPTELYYSDVYKAGDPDYNWNFNGNSHYGEGGDKIDFGPDHFIGRMPFSSIDELDAILSKTMGYEKADVPDLTYYNNVMFMTGFLSDYFNEDTFRGDELNELIDYIAPLNTNLNFWRLYDDPSLGGMPNCEWDETFNLQNTLNNLENGGTQFGSPFHLVYHMDHSGPPSMSTSSKVAKECMNTLDADGLSNSPYYQIFYTGGCSPNAFDYQDAISEHYHWNPNGAGAAFIGNTVYGMSTDSDYFGNFCNLLYNNSSIRNISDLLYGASTSYTYLRRVALLGDPTLDIWTNTPQNLTVDAIPTTLYTGQQNLQVNIDDLSNGDIAKVCLYKENEVYSFEEVTGTGSTVSVNIECTPDTPGELYLTVTGHNYIPFETSLPVSINPGTHLYIEDYAVDDDESGSSNGNDNNLVDVGETIELTMVIENQGLTAGDNVTGTISLDPEHTSYNFITISQPQSSFGTIESLEQVASVTPFVFTVSVDAPDNLMGKFILNLEDGASNIYQDELYIEFHTSEADLVSTTFTTQINDDEIIDAGDHVYVTFELFNGGSGLATELMGNLSSSSAYVEAIGSPDQAFGDVAPYTSGENTLPYEFDVTGNYAGETIEMTLLVVDQFGKEWEFPVNFDKPDMISGLGYTNSNTEISLYWDPDVEAKGYNAYQSDIESGPYNKLNSQIIEDFSGYTDAGLPELTTFYYRVSGVSNFGIEGDLTDPLETWTTLPYHPDWMPVLTSVSLYGAFWGAPNIFDLDNDSEMEIFLTSGGGDHPANKGAVYSFNQDGTEVYNIDNNITTISGFANIEISMTCTPAIGDIDNDGIAEVIVATRMGQPENDPTKFKLFVYKNEDANEDSKPDLMWDRQIAFKNFNGVVLDDMNNDGYMEIIVPNQIGEHLEVLDYEGNNYQEWPVTTYEDPVDDKAVSMPVVVDLDSDGDKEIVIGMEGGIYIWNSDGSDYIQGQNPVNTGIGGRLDCPVIVADIDNDSDYEILFMSIQGTTGYIYALENNGTLVNNWNTNNHSIQLSIENQNWSWSPFFSCGDIDMDGTIEVVIADNGLCKVWDYLGNEIISIEIPNLKCQYLRPLIANVDDNDQDCEILIPSNDGLIHAYKLNGDKVVGWPLNTYNPYGMCSIPLIADIDNDSKNEIVSSSDYKIFVWDTEGKSNKNQWDRFALNSHNNAVFHNTCSYNSNPLVINEDQTWNTDRWMDRDIQIDQGTLTIHGTVRLAAESKIIVKPGAELIIDGGKLMNGCGNTWHGIEVWGDKNSSQFETGGVCAQGKVVLTNAVIENAYEAVRLWKPGDYNSTGGIIIAENTVFTNCRRAVEFMSYRNFNPYDPQTEMDNLSRFKNCTFKIDENYSQPSVFFAHVSLWKVRGIPFEGCRFYNLDDSSDPFGNGIVSEDAGITVNSYCTIVPPGEEPCPPENTVVSKFEGFQKALYCTNEETSYNVRVRQSDFTNNIYGIYNSGSNNEVIVDNNFLTTKETGSYSINVLLDGCTGFTVEENDFTSTVGPPFHDFYLYGIWVNNSGEEENLIYKNYFSNMFIANHASGINLVDKHEFIGLKYECNTNTNNVYDFVVDELGGISVMQGSLEQSAGNTFTHNVSPYGSDFANNGNWIIEYYYDPNEASEIPQNYYGLRLDQGEDHPCYSNFGTRISGLADAEKSLIMQSYTDNTSEYNAALTAYNSFEDEGDQPQLISDIESSQPDETGELRERLLDDSPHLSEEALRTAAEKWNVLPANILFEILSANPDELGDEEFLDYLANKPDPLPEYMIDMLRDTIGVETYKTILRSELGHYSLGRQDAANKLIANELADTASASLDTLRYWLNEKNGMGSRFSIVDSYLHENNLVSASDELNSIPGMIELSDWEAREYNYFVFLKNLLISLKNNNKTIFDIDSIQKLSLDTIADSSHFIAGAQARGVLNFVFNEDSLLIPFLPDTSLFKNSPVNFGDQGYNKNEELFRVIPNPARDWISIEYKLSGEIAGATIEMLNQMGIKIREIEVFKNRGIKNMNIEDVLPGTYLFLCKVNGKIIGNQKIIVIK